MPIYRVTMRFTGGGVGWTESHSLTSTLTTCRSVAGTLQDLVNKRANCLGSPYIVDGFRVAQIRDNLGAAVTRVSALVKTQFAPLVAVPADAAPVGVILQFKDIAEMRQKNTIMGGPPQGVVSQGYQYTGAAGNFTTNLGAFTTALQAAQVGWQQWIALGNKLAISGYTLDMTGRVVFTVSNANFQGPFPWLPQEVRISGVNGGSVLNGEMLVDVLSANTFRSHKPIGCGSYISGGMVQFYLQPLGFVKAAFIGSPSGGQHKRGNRSFHSPGRARKRIRV